MLAYDFTSMTSADSFSHIDDSGRANMVDVSEKPVSRRVAEASCRVEISASTTKRLSELPKGDAFVVAKLAGVQGAKKTAELIPLAHPLSPEQIDIEVEPVEAGVEIRSRIVVNARTGAEMEALVACSTAALALYDMVKAVEREARITDIQLEHKSGGTRGEFRRTE